MLIRFCRMILKWNLNNKAPKTNKSLDMYLTPATDEDIETIISTFELNKAIYSNSIPVKTLINISKSNYRSRWKNLLFSTEKFPKLLKLTKIFLVIKKIEQQKCNNYRNLSFLSIEKLTHQWQYLFFNSPS